MKDILKFKSYGSSLNRPASLKGIGNKRSTFENRHENGDALFHFPAGMKTGAVKEISEVSPGEVLSALLWMERQKGKKYYIIKARLLDPTSKQTMTAVWFNQRYLLGRLRKGREIVVMVK